MSGFPEKGANLRGASGEVAGELAGKFGELPGKSRNFPEAQGSLTPSQRLAKFLSSVRKQPKHSCSILLPRLPGCPPGLKGEKDPSNNPPKMTQSGSLMRSLAKGFLRNFCGKLVVLRQETSGAKRAHKSPKIARTAAKNFLNNSRGLLVMNQ